MTEGSLGNVVIIDLHIAVQGLVQMLPGLEAGGTQHLADAPVEALDHAVGLRMAGLGQAMLDGVGRADLIEGMLSGGLAFSRSAEPVSELLTVVGQHLGHLERGLGQEAFQEPLGMGGTFLREDLDVDPTGGPINGGEE